jgi:protocatechuate 3,4-dioxygenase beta subunit
MKFFQFIGSLTIVLTLLTGCGSNVTGVATVAATAVPVMEVPATVAGPSPTNEAEASAAPVTPTVEQPAQTEEQAVLSAFSQPITAGGDLLVLYGHVLDASGAPLSGYTVEIWQVDANGIYDHPGDANTANRDPGFQFYGTALTDENGLFAFRTIVPARYEPRPRHIHFKVKKDGAEVLTSQFYFSGDADAAQAGPGVEMLLLELRDVKDARGTAIKLAFKDIVLDTGSGGNLPLTPLQTEGPYYPVIAVAAFDNDLASVQ